MLSMWKRRLLTALIVIGFAAIGAVLDIHGYAGFAYVGVSVSLAVVLGILFEAHLQVRQRARVR